MANQEFFHPCLDKVREIKSLHLVARGSEPNIHIVLLILNDNQDRLVSVMLLIINATIGFVRYE